MTSVACALSARDIASPKFEYIASKSVDLNNLEPWNKKHKKNGNCFQAEILHLNLCIYHQEPDNDQRG